MNIPPEFPSSADETVWRGQRAPKQAPKPVDLAELVLQAIPTIEEAASYVSTPTWSPSMHEELMGVLASLRGAITPQPE